MNYLTIVVARLIVRLVARVVSAFVYAIRGNPAEAICVGCIHAHIAVGLRSTQRITSCTYGGTLRELKFAVSDCSMFCHCDAKPELVRVIGFAETHADQSVGPAIAAQIKELTD